MQIAHEAQKKKKKWAKDINRHLSKKPIHRQPKSTRKDAQPH